MPGMNGDQLCEKLRSLRQTKDVPIVMVTAKGLEMDLARLEDELQVAGGPPKAFFARRFDRTGEASAGVRGVLRLTTNAHKC